MKTAVSEMPSGGTLALVPEAEAPKENINPNYQERKRALGDFPDYFGPEEGIQQTGTFNYMLTTTSAVAVAAQQAKNGSTVTLYWLLDSINTDGAPIDGTTGWIKYTGKLMIGEVTGNPDGVFEVPTTLHVETRATGVGVDA